MRLAIGIDVGWSPRRRSCGLAVRGPVSVTRGRQFGAHTSVGLFTLDELVDELERLARLHADPVRNAILVIDGPVGPGIEAEPRRAIDGLFACGGFSRRAPAYRITEGSGLELSKATGRILRALSERVPVQPWLGGPIPNAGLVVAETNPTPAMALLLPQQEIDSLPSRARPKRIEDTVVAAKSDWYWRLGAGRYAARVLGHEGIANERNHERVAALFALALATVMADADTASPPICALGDKDGVYVVPSDIDESWMQDVQRVGIAHGTPRPRSGDHDIGAEAHADAATIDVLGIDDEKTRADSSQSSDGVIVVLNDNAGLNLAANPWLEEVDIPCQLTGPRSLSFSVTSQFKGRNDQFKLTPSAREIAHALGFTVDHLSKTSPVVFEATLVSR